MCEQSKAPHAPVVARIGGSIQNGVNFISFTISLCRFAIRASRSEGYSVSGSSISCGVPNSLATWVRITWSAGLGGRRLQLVWKKDSPGRARRSPVLTAR